MSLVVVGSVALDSITTPFGVRENTLGGAASYFSIGASLFTPVQLVGVIGDDFPEEHVAFIGSRDVDLAGLERRAGAKTFRWRGQYVGRMDVAETLKTELNVLGEFKPTLPDSFRNTSFAFLANGDPITQAHVFDQLVAPRFVLLDTMNFWIDSAREALMAAISRVNGVIMNDEEARALGGSANLVKAMHHLSDRGVRTLVVKKGEHGSVLLHEGQMFALPAFPLQEVLDPTGAGDSFASGFMGALAQSGDLSFESMKRALLAGTCVASFTVEGFGLERIGRLERAELDRRIAAFVEIIRY